MDILVLNWRDIKNPEAGGAEVHLHEILRRIAMTHHEVVFVSSKFKNCKDYEVVDGLKVIRIGNKFFFNFSAFWYYMTKLRKEHFDIVIDGVSKIPLYTPLYIKKPLVAIIHHIHGKTLFKELPFLMGAYVYFSEKLIPFFYKHIPFITVSESTKKELIRMGIPKKNIKVIYNAFDHELHKLGKKSEMPLVAYVGRIKKYKQLDLLIKAFRLVKKRLPKAELIVAGKGNCHKELKGLADKLGMNLELHGEITDEEKVRILQSSWVFVTPSMKEGWGITVIEANACGTPAIAFNVPGLRDSIKNERTGLLVEYDNIKSLSEAIIDILENEHLRKKLSKNAFDYSKQFTWNESTLQVLRLLEGMMVNVENTNIMLGINKIKN